MIPFLQHVREMNKGDRLSAAHYNGVARMAARHVSGGTYVSDGLGTVVFPGGAGSNLSVITGEIVTAGPYSLGNTAGPMYWVKLADIVSDGLIISEIWELTVSGFSVEEEDEFTLTYDGQTTAAITVESAASIQSALEALSNVEPGDLLVSEGTSAHTYRITAADHLQGQNLTELSVASETGCSVSVSTIQDGEDPDEALPAVFDTDDNVYVAATNLCEQPFGTHLIRPGTIVTLWSKPGITEGDTTTRWFFSM
ncbi:MAG: hypothetical protein ABFE01_05605, partial [Phycisphaerales bacterium]